MPGKQSLSSSTETMSNHINYNNSTNNNHIPQCLDMIEDIVISGISGRFPEADNIDELKENLYNHIDMINEDERRWPAGFYGLPTRLGKMKDLSKFDAQFFGVHGKQANNMDPQARILLELTYEAIVDAGINPQLLRGTRTGVYVGACTSEVEEALVSDVNRATGYALTGCSRSMISNRVSFTFDFQGPSYTIDTACSSSFLALQQAILAIRTNECDQAIVAGVNICVRPATSLSFLRLNMLSPDGKCQHMDSNANGYVRSETCSVVFLQRKSQAKRIYATIIHAKTNTDGHKEEGITFPSWRTQMNIMKETIQEAGINPLDVNYVEAHGTGTPAGDPVETKAIAQVFCQGRSDPLLIGSVKSNLGHAEPASGMNSLAKVLLTFQNKMIPANLHFKSANTNIPELMAGQVVPVVENTEYKDGIVAINSFGFGGVNVHVLLKPHTKESNESDSKIVDKIPRIILATGRSDDSVEHILEFIEKNPKKVNREFLQLLHDASQTYENSGMNTRGFMILDRQPDGSTTFPKEIGKVPERRPIWFVYSGMGSQWTSMAKGLMPLDIFRNSIEKSATILKDYDINLMDLLLSNNEQILETTVAPFVAIAAVQIALTDLLRKLGIQPDGIVGHSVGELGCAYADEVFDHRQMLLAAYWRGKSVEEANLPKGLMAAVGLTWEEAKSRCPKGVVPACHNSQDSVTISGDYDTTKKFVEQLREENIFAREVKSCGVAFHSYYMEAIAPTLLEKLEKVIPDRKLRTSRWPSTSFPESRWNEDIAKYSSAAYYVNNLTSPVLFHEAVQLIPKNAILIEIAPHCLLQPIVKRTLGADISYIALMKRNNNDGNLNMLLSAIGKLYNLGLNPDISILYPKIEYPVSRNVQSLSPLVKWDHSQSWLVTLYPEFFNPNNLSDYSVKVDLQDQADKFYAGHCIDGRILFPATGYLYLAWQILSKIKGQFCEKTPVEFENVTLHRATILNKDNPVKFEIRLMEINGEFTISEGGTVVVTGRVFVPEKSPLKLQGLLEDGSVRSEDSIKLLSKDIYKELRLRGYDYGPTFQGIEEATSDSKLGKLKFSNWIVLADTMLQIGILGKSTRGLYLPVRFQSVRCDPKILFEAVANAGENPMLPVVNDPRINSTIVPGLEIQGLKVNLAPRRLGGQVPVLEKCKFTPYHENGTLDQQIQSQIDEYNLVISFLANQMIDLFKISSLQKSKIKIDESTLKKYLKNQNQFENFTILQCMNEMIENPEESKRILNNSIENICSDLLSTASETQPYIGALIDLAIENIPSSKWNIVEVNPSRRLLVEMLKPYLESSSYSASLNYTLVTSKQDKPEVQDVQHICWDFKSTFPIENDLADLLILKDSNIFDLDEQESIDYSKFLESAQKSIKPNGFLLGLFRGKPTFAETVLQTLLKVKPNNQDNQINSFKSEAEKIGFKLVASRQDTMTCSLFLFRKIDTIDPKKQAVIHVTNLGYEKWVEDLKLKIFEYQQRKDPNENIWLVGQDHPANGLVGLVKCLRQEPGGNRIRCILSSPLNSNDQLPAFKSFDQDIYAEILQKDLVMNVYRDQKFGSFRHFEIDAETMIETEHAYLNVATRGDLSSLKWYESEHKHWPILPAEIRTTRGSLFSVYYAPLNFRDVMLATGKLPPDALPGDLALQDCILGLEFSGRDSQSGQRLMGMVPAKGLATTAVISDNDFMWPIPDQWTMEEASTVPVVYSTAYYALLVRGELEPNETVLIHSGSGGVGQAAISICLSMGCTVFTTVGTEEKRNYLKARFPQLTDRNIANSRDVSFEQHVLRETNGQGVDIVLNSLSEEKLQASVRCLAQHGRFLEIGKYDLSQNNPLGMAAFLKNITFHGILLDALLERSSNSALVDAHKKMVTELVREGIKTGAVRPLKSNLFDMDRAEDAFRFMASGKHIGKVVLQIRKEENQKAIVPPKHIVPAIARTMFIPMKSYIITGGLGGFGLELTRWLVERGAKKIVLNSRSGPRKPYQHLCLKWLEGAGVKYLISTANIATMDGAKKLLDEASSLAPVGGIFNLAMVLSDGFFENQTAESFEKVCQAKVLGTQNLDKLSRMHCPQLDYFVAFSSISCGRGNAGQTNYGFANSSMERVCELRRAAGLHGLAIQWGAIGDVGVVSENMGGNEVVIGGTLPQRIPSCLAVLDRFLQTPEAVCCSHVRAKRQATSSGSGGKKQDLVKTIAHILGIKNHENLAPTTSLSELGMDSLMGVEVKQFLERDYEVIFSMQELRSMTISNLNEIGGGKQSSKSSSNQNQSQIELSPLTLHLPTEKYLKLNDIEDGQPVFFLPPIEGSFIALENLAKQLKRPVFGLNWTLELNQFDSIEQVTPYFIELVKSLQKKSSSSSPSFNIVGYSFGTIIAFDMALKLQNQNKSSKISLTMLDATPICLAQSCNVYLQHTNVVNDSDSVFIEAAITFLMQITAIDYAQVKNQLIQLSNKEQRLKFIADIIQKQTNQSESIKQEDILLAVESFIRKSMLMCNYKVEKYQGDLLLIRAQESIFIKNGEMPIAEDYGASQIITGNPEYHIFPGNHKTFLIKNANKIAEIIQEKLF